MLEAAHYSPGGAKRDSAFSLPGDYFDGDVNQPVLHQAVKTYLNNQRQGTHRGINYYRASSSAGNHPGYR